MAARINRSQGKRRRSPHIEHLTRIIIYLEEIGKFVNQSNITENTAIHSVYIRPALDWLVNYGLIKKDVSQRRVLYYRLGKGEYEKKGFCYRCCKEIKKGYAYESDFEWEILCKKCYRCKGVKRT